MRKDTIFSRFLHEPLFHFLLLGIGIFFLFSQINREEKKDDKQKIILSASKIQSLSVAFLRERGRAPTAKEMKKLLESEIREEVLSREALAMGLEKDDLLIRRRLAQKMQYLFEDTALIKEPSDKELQAFLQENPSKFTLPETLSFVQVYLDPKTHKNTLDEDLRNLSQSLKQTSLEEALNLGDRSLLGYEFSDKREDDILRIFGEKFSQKLFEVPEHSWKGPFSSAYGMHFVYIHSRNKALVPPLSQIKSRVTYEYKRVKQVQANELFYTRLKDRYDISVDDEVLKIANLSAL